MLRCPRVAIEFTQTYSTIGGAYYFMHLIQICIATLSIGNLLVNLIWLDGILIECGQNSYQCPVNLFNGHVY